MPGDLEHVSAGQPVSPTARTWNAFIDAARDHAARKGRQGGGALPMPLEASLKCLIENTGSSITTLACFSVQAYSTPPILPETDESSRLLINRRPVFEGATPTSAADPFVITCDPIPGQSIGQAIIAGLAVVQVEVHSTDHKRARPIVGDDTKLESCDSGGVPIIYKEGGEEGYDTGTKWAIVLLGGGSSASAVHWVKLSGSGTGIDGGTAWGGRIQDETSGTVGDNGYIGSDPDVLTYCLYKTLAADGSLGSPAVGDIVLAVPDQNTPGVWLFQPKKTQGFECGGCGWLEDLPTDTCFKFRMDGGEGRCSCIPSEGYSTSGSGNWVAALNGWVATQMKDACCGCGGVLLDIDSSNCDQSTVELHSFHVKCDAGGISQLFTLTMKYDCSGINEETGNRFARFVGKGASACDGDQEPCNNSFYLTVECFTCPEPVCGCCCEEWSPWSWYQWDIIGFGDDNLNGSWVWEYDDSTPNSCKWIATCGAFVSTLEYNSSGGGVMRLTHGTYVYELARASWTCNGANVLAYVSGGGTHPASITLNPLQTVDPGVTPCDLPDSLEVELISAGCPDMNAVITATRAISGTGPWEYGTPGGLVVTVECGSDGRFEVAVSIECDDGSPPPVAFLASTAPDAPDTTEWGPLELTWNNVAITGTPTVGECCNEGSTVTIIVRE